MWIEYNIFNTTLVAFLEYCTLNWQSYNVRDQALGNSLPSQGLDCLCECMTPKPLEPCKHSSMLWKKIMSIQSCKLLQNLLICWHNLGYSIYGIAFIIIRVCYCCTFVLFPAPGPLRCVGGVWSPRVHLLESSADREHVIMFWLVMIMAIIIIMIIMILRRNHLQSVASLWPY